ncbi:MAG: hypothetical protein WDW36_004816 [Sanguina aurantia]
MQALDVAFVELAHFGGTHSLLVQRICGITIPTCHIARQQPQQQQQSPWGHKSQTPGLPHQRRHERQQPSPPASGRTAQPVRAPDVRTTRLSLETGPDLSSGQVIARLYGTFLSQAQQSTALQQKQQRQRQQPYTDLDRAGLPTSQPPRETGHRPGHATSAHHHAHLTQPPKQSPGRHPLQPTPTPLHSTSQPLPQLSAAHSGRSEPPHLGSASRRHQQQHGLNPTPADPQPTHGGSGGGGGGMRAHGDGRQRSAGTGHWDPGLRCITWSYNLEAGQSMVELCCDVAAVLHAQGMLSRLERLAHQLGTPLSTASSDVHHACGGSGSSAGAAQGARQARAGQGGFARAATHAAVAPCDGGAPSLGSAPCQAVAEPRHGLTNGAHRAADKPPPLPQAPSRPGSLPGSVERAVHGSGEGPHREAQRQAAAAAAAGGGGAEEEEDEACPPSKRQKTAPAVGGELAGVELHPAAEAGGAAAGAEVGAGSAAAAVAGADSAATGEEAAVATTAAAAVAAAAASKPDGGHVSPRATNTPADAEAHPHTAAAHLEPPHGELADSEAGVLPAPTLAPTEQAAAVWHWPSCGTLSLHRYSHAHAVLRFQQPSTNPLRRLQPPTDPPPAGRPVTHEADGTALPTGSTKQPSTPSATVTVSADHPAAPPTAAPPTAAPTHIHLTWLPVRSVTPTAPSSSNQNTATEPAASACLPAAVPPPATAAPTSLTPASQAPTPTASPPAPHRSAQRGTTAAASAAPRPHSTERDGGGGAAVGASTSLSRAQPRPHAVHLRPRMACSVTSDGAAPAAWHDSIARMLEAGEEGLALDALVMTCGPMGAAGRATRPARLLRLCGMSGREVRHVVTTPPYQHRLVVRWVLAQAGALSGRRTAPGKQLSPRAVNEGPGQAQGERNQGEGEVLPVRVFCAAEDGHILLPESAEPWSHPSSRVR